MQTSQRESLSKSLSKPPKDTTKRSSDYTSNNQSRLQKQNSKIRSQSNLAEIPENESLNEKQILESQEKNDYGESNTNLKNDVYRSQQMDDTLPLPS